MEAHQLSSGVTSLSFLQKRKRNGLAYLHLCESSATADPGIRGWKQRILLAIRQGARLPQQDTIMLWWHHFFCFTDGWNGGRACTASSCFCLNQDPEAGVYVCVCMCVFCSGRIAPVQSPLRRLCNACCTAASQTPARSGLHKGTDGDRDDTVRAAPSSAVCAAPTVQQGMTPFLRRNVLRDWRLFTEPFSSGTRTSSCLSAFFCPETVASPNSDHE